MLIAWFVFDSVLSAYLGRHCSQHFLAVHEDCQRPFWSWLGANCSDVLTFWFLALWFQFIREPQHESESDSHSIGSRPSCTELAVSIETSHLTSQRPLYPV